MLDIIELFFCWLRAYQFAHSLFEKRVDVRLRLFDAHDVPRVTLPLPPEVKDVHFIVDLTHVVEQDPVALAAHSEFFAQVLP